MSETSRARLTINEWWLEVHNTIDELVRQKNLTKETSSSFKNSFKTLKPVRKGGLYNKVSSLSRRYEIISRGYREDSRLHHLAIKSRIYAGEADNSEYQDHTLIGKCKVDLQNNRKRKPTTQRVGKTDTKGDFTLWSSMEANIREGCNAMFGQIPMQFGEHESDRGEFISTRLEACKSYLTSQYNDEILFSGSSEVPHWKEWDWETMDDHHLQISFTAEVTDAAGTKQEPITFYFDFEGEPKLDE